MILTLKQSGPIETYYDGYDVTPPVAIVGDASTAWRDNSDATYAQTESPSQQQIVALSTRSNSAIAPMETASITDFTRISIHVRLRTDSNYTGLMPDNFTAARQFNIDWRPAGGGPYDYIRRPVVSSGAIADYDEEIWPGYYNPETDLSEKAMLLAWITNGHSLHITSIAGGFQQPTDWWSKAYVYEMWMTVDAPAPPVLNINGQEGGTRRRFVYERGI